MASLPDGGMRLKARPRAFEQPDETTGIHEARELFFQAVHHVEPHVVSDLMGEPLNLVRPMFEQALDRLPEDRRHAWRYWDVMPSWGTFAFAGDFSPPEAHRVKALLERWSRKWRLRDEWCLQAAVDTLIDLCAAGERMQPCPLVYLGRRMIRIPFRDDELAFSFTHPGWQPTLQSWEQAERAMRAAFNRELQAYRERIASLAQERGLVPTTMPRTRGGDPLNWLARYVVGRDTYSEIGREDGVTRQAVARAVKGQAALIGLSLPDNANHQPSSLST